MDATGQPSTWRCSLQAEATAHTRCLRRHQLPRVRAMTSWEQRVPGEQLARPIRSRAMSEFRPGHALTLGSCLIADEWPMAGRATIPSSGGSRVARARTERKPSHGDPGPELGPWYVGP